MKSVIRRLHEVVDHPWTNIVVACVLIGTSVFELIEPLLESIDPGIGAHHGLLVLGVTQLLKALPELAEASERLLHDDDEGS